MSYIWPKKNKFVYHEPTLLERALAPINHDKFVRNFPFLDLNNIKTQQKVISCYLNLLEPSSYLLSLNYSCLLTYSSMMFIVYVAIRYPNVFSKIDFFNCLQNVNYRANMDAFSLTLSQIGDFEIRSMRQIEKSLLYNKKCYFDWYYDLVFIRSKAIEWSEVRAINDNFTQRDLCNLYEVRTNLYSIELFMKEKPTNQYCFYRTYDDPILQEAFIECVKFLLFVNDIHI